MGECPGMEGVGESLHLIIINQCLTSKEVTGKISQLTVGF